jgi:hypothetical protein
MALGKYKLALRDYERVCKVRPNDKDAKLKFTECRKIVQQIAFNKAISVEDQKAASVAEALDIESMTVEDKYDGPKLNLDQPSGKDTNTGKSLSEVLILASTNPQYDNRLFIELPVQYLETTS